MTKAIRNKNTHSSNELINFGMLYINDQTNNHFKAMIIVIKDVFKKNVYTSNKIVNKNNNLNDLEKSE